MEKIKNESELKSKLGIENWSELSNNENFLKYLAYLEKTDKELQMKTLEQIPNVLSLAKEVTSGMIVLAKEHSKTSKEYLSVLQSISNHLGSMLNKDNLTFEERKYIIDSLLKLAAIIRELQTDHNKFMIKLAGIFGIVGMGIIAIIKAYFGGGNNDKNSMT